jgi:hypothetical protein
MLIQSQPFLPLVCLTPIVLASTVQYGRATIIYNLMYWQLSAVGSAFTKNAPNTARTGQVSLAQTARR